MTYIKINDVLFSAIISGQNVDKEWDNRESKSIRLTGTYQEVSELITDNVKWAIVMEELVNVTPQYVTDEDGNFVYEQIDVTPRYATDPETGEFLTDEEGKILPYTGERVYKDGALIPYNGEPIYETHLIEYDNSEYSVRGDILVHVDGTCTVKMGKPTALEAAQLNAAVKEAEMAEIAARNEELQLAIDILLGGNV